MKFGKNFTAVLLSAGLCVTAVFSCGSFQSYATETNPGTTAETTEPAEPEGQAVSEEETEPEGQAETLAVTMQEAEQVADSDLIPLEAYANTHTNTGNYAEDLIAVALTQVGYVENSDNTTKYGQWWGSPTAEWCTIFYSWCARQAGIPTTILKSGAEPNSMLTWFKSNGTYHAKAGYTPQPGDLIFFKYGSSSRTTDHIGIVWYSQNGYVYTLEGNSTGGTAYYGVRNNIFALSKSEIVGYVTPNYGQTPLTNPSGTTVPTTAPTTAETTQDPTNADGYSVDPLLGYSADIQDRGWITAEGEGAECGTTGQSLRLQALKVSIIDGTYAGSVTYRTHMQSVGWTDWSSDGEVSGLPEAGKRMEAVQIKLTGQIAEYYDVYYRLHVQTYGWLGWAKNGESAGSEGLAKRVESMQVVLVAKGNEAPGGDAEDCFITPLDVTQVTYSTHVQKIGWQTAVSDGALAGTSGQSLRLEGIRVALQNGYGSIRYKTHVQTYGWQDWAADGAVSGTVGEGKRLEAICIELQGSAANYFDVYYRVHVQTYGWLGWAKNGQISGTTGLKKRLEAIEIKLVPKGQEAPGSTENYCISK